MHVGSACLHHAWSPAVRRIVQIIYKMQGTGCPFIPIPVNKCHLFRRLMGAEPLSQNEQLYNWCLRQDMDISRVHDRALSLESLPLPTYLYYNEP